MTGDEKLNIFINICIFTTFIFCIILIADELYNMVKFTYSYTNLYNLGAFTEKFNKDKTIEMETIRYNIYSNIEKYYLSKDVYSKSYLNYLIVIAITIITLLFVASYAMYFYNLFINDKEECNPIVANFNDKSIIKKFIRCLGLIKLETYIPNCTLNYIVFLFIIIIVPLFYIIKLLFNYDIKSRILNFSYNIINVLLLFYYGYKLIISTFDDDSIPLDEKIKIIVIYITFTILYISARYIYDYTYNTYNDGELITKFNKTVFFDLYKQKEPIKPKELSKPMLNGEDLSITFTYSQGDTKDRNYLKKKQMMDEYYIQLKKYKEDLAIYKEKYNIYKKLKIKLPENLGIIDIPYNMLGFNDKFLIYLHVVFTFICILNYYYKDGITKNDNKYSYNCLVYIICVLLILTLSHAVTYYNTYLNKYIIYEPMAQYKSDITVANTKLNILMNDAMGGNDFYKSLINNSSNTSNSGYNSKNYLSKNDIIEKIKTIANSTSPYNYEIITQINTDIINNTDNVYNNDNSNTQIIKDYDLCYNNNNAGHNPLNHLITNIISVETHNKIENTIREIYFYYNNKYITVKTNYVKYYFIYIYAILQYVILCNEYYMVKYIMAQSANIPNKLSSILEIVAKLKIYGENQLKNYTINDMDEEYIKNNLQDILTDADKTNKITIKDKYLSLIQSIYTDVNRVIRPTATTTIELFTDTQLNNILEYGSNLINIFSSNIISVNTPINISNCEVIYNKSAGTSNLLRTTSVSLIDTSTITVSSYDIKSLKLTINNIVTYYKLPTNIIDNNKNEYSININISQFFTTQNTYIYVNQHSYDASTNLQLYSFNDSVRNTSPIIHRDKSIEPIMDSVSQFTAVAFNLSGKSFNLPYKIFIHTDSYINDRIKYKVYYTLHNTFVNVLNRNITNSTPNLYKLFVNNKSQNKNILFYDKFNSNPSLNINTNSQNTLYTIPETTKGTDTNLALISIIYNVVMIDTNKIKNLLDNINFLIYNDDDNVMDHNYFDETTYRFVNDKKEILENSIYINQPNLTNSIKTSIMDVGYNNNELITLYNQNISIIKLIILLYSKLILFLKTEISNVDPKLCSKINPDMDTVEKFITEHFSVTINTPTQEQTSTITITELTTTTSLYTPNSSSKKAIDNINKNIAEFFNIVIFLMDNLTANDLESINVVIKNYNFYNNNIFTNKDLIKLPLNISCNYYNKYYDMTNRDITNMKNNVSLVSYNFIVLMTALSVVIFEPMLIIKS